MPKGMTMIELIVGIAILAIALVVGGVAFGAVTGAETNQAAGELSTAVRYTYNLAAINNKTYALFLDLDNNTYKVGAVDTTNDSCSASCSALHASYRSGSHPILRNTTTESSGSMTSSQ